jgi:starvation-inducible DNA-binding protein
MRPWKTKDTVDNNPIGIARESAERLVRALDPHVASLFVLFHQYQKHHWLVEGPQYHDLHLFLQGAYEAVHKQADRIAERITALGGIPTSGPAEQAKLAYVEHEPEGAFRIRAALELDLGHEAGIARRLRDSVRLAQQEGDFGTEHLLKDVLLETEDRAHHIEHYLGDDSLERDPKRA